MSSEKYDLDYPAFAVITDITGVLDVDLIPDLSALKKFLEELINGRAVIEDDIVYVCEIKDVIIPKIDPIYSNHLCPEDMHPLRYDESEECYFCEVCNRYYYENELRAIYDY